MKTIIALALVALAPFALAASVADVDVRLSGFTDHATGTPITAIAAGDTVRWTVLDGGHNVISYTGEFASSTMGSDETFEHAFALPGAYPYRCTLHANMQGVVIVSA